MQPKLRSIQLPGRVRLEFAEQGSRSGMAVIALHGVTDSWRSFEPVLPHLPPDLHVLALTQRGHGGSDKPADSCRPADFIGDDYSARLREIDMPTLLVWGRHDAFCPAAEQAALLGLLGNARRVEYADAGHALHREEPQRFALDLSRFVNTVAAAAAAA